MTNKKRDEQKKNTELENSRTDVGPSGEDKPRKRARARRLVLKSIVTGGAVTTAKSLPDKWTRPITDSVLMPAHAQVSGPVSLSCRVETFGSTSGFESADGDLTGLTFNPSGAPFTGGANTFVDQFVDSGNGDAVGDVEISLEGISATLDPAGAGDVTLSLATDGDFDLDSGAGPFDVAPNGSGVASFPDINGDFIPPDQGGGATADLELRFSAPGVDDCVIAFTFQEFFPPPPAPE